MRIGMFSQWYDPERGAAAQAGVVARALHDQGHSVEVLTGFPNYPGGTIYPGYRLRPYQHETLEGISVHRTPLRPSHDSSAARRMVTFLSYAASASLAAPARLTNCDVGLVYSTPATAAIPAMVNKTLRRLPFVILIEDLWPQSVLNSGFLDSALARAAERALNLFCDQTYRSAAHVAVTSPGMADALLERGVPHDKVTFVPNWANESVFRPVARDDELAERLGVAGSRTVMYAGNFGEYQDLSNLLRAAGLLRDRTDLKFVLVGEGVAEKALRQQVADDKLSNVVFVPAQPTEKMSDILAIGDVQVISLVDLPLFRMTLPSKLQATLAAGRPVVGSIAGDGAEILRRSGAGRVVPPSRPELLAEAIDSMFDPSESLTNRGRAARDYYLAHFAQERVVQDLSALLASAAGTRR